MFNNRDNCFEIGTDRWRAEACHQIRQSRDLHGALMVGVSLLSDILDQICLVRGATYLHLHPDYDQIITALEDDVDSDECRVLWFNIRRLFVFYRDYHAHQLYDLHQVIADYLAEFYEDVCELDRDEIECLFLNILTGSCCFASVVLEHHEKP